MNGLSIYKADKADKMWTRIGLEQLKTKLDGCFTVVDSKVFALFRDFLPDDCFVLDPNGFYNKEHCNLDNLDNFNNADETDNACNLKNFSGAESVKCFAAAELIVHELLRRGAGRSITLAAVGGGAIGDLVGFVASIFMRGVDWICVPTTVTAVVDSSIGGKTALNVGAKNSVGSFHLPRKIYFCQEFLATLPSSEVKNGFSEVVKTALLDKKLFEKTEKFLGRAAAFSLSNSSRCSIFDQDCIKSAEFLDLLSRAAEIKSHIVSADPLDRGKRRVLNMGHTVGHSLEYAYGLSHGEAVAAGLLLESLICGAGDARILQLGSLFVSVNFPTVFQTKFDAERLTAAAMCDKKNNGNIVIVAPIKLGKTAVFAFDKSEFSKRLTQGLSQIKLTLNTKNNGES